MVLSTGLLAVGCGPSEAGSGAADGAEGPPRQVARSAHGMVAAAHPAATAAGAGILAVGGNAVDAAVATAFALAVAEPSMSGLGGRAQLLIHLPDGRVEGIDGSVTFPAAFMAQVGVGGGEPSGYGAIGVPGMVAAMDEALRRHGTLSLAEVIAPAIRLAEEGVRLGPIEAERLADPDAGLTEFPATRALFFHPDGAPLREGELLVQSELAATLRAIAEGGAEAFYRGDLARRIAADMVEHGGWVGLEDLARYRAVDMEVLRGRYRGAEVVVNSFPSSGPMLLQALQTLEHFSLEGRVGTPQWGVTVAGALALAVEDRRADLGTMEEKVRTVTSPEWAERRARDLRQRLEGGGAPLAFGRQAEAWVAVDATSHLSVADPGGMVVALTQSLGPGFGSGVVTPGLGFVWAATLDRMPPPEQLELGRPVLNQSPVLVYREGEPVFALGAAGGSRIPSSLLSTLSRLLDQGLPLADAVAAPRVHPRSDGSIEVEALDGPGWPTGAREGFQRLGVQVEPLTNHARIHAVERDPAGGGFVGVADPRRTGSASGPGPFRP